MATVKCKYCGEPVDKKEAVGGVGHWHHPECLKIVEEREKFITYTILLFKLFSSEDRSAIIANRRMSTIYKKKYNYTYRGMWKSLVYFYEIKKNSTIKSNGRIGIIPYVYDEAQEYFKKIDEKTKATMDKKYEEIKIVRDIQQLEKTHEEKRELIDLNDL